MSEGLVVWKFGPFRKSASDITLPRGTRMLTAGFQNLGNGNEVYMWGLVPLAYTHDTEIRHFEIFGTGQQFSIQIDENARSPFVGGVFGDDLLYVGSAVSDFEVCHVFERKARSKPEGWGE